MLPTQANNSLEAAHASFTKENTPCLGLMQSCTTTI